MARTICGMLVNGRRKFPKKRAQRRRDLRDQRCGENQGEHFFLLLFVWGLLT
jgi:hypothetical protein